MAEKPTKHRRKLNPRQAAYKANRKKGKSQRASALAAGYSPRRAHVVGSEIERAHPEMRDEIAASIEKALSRDNTLGELARVAMKRSVDREKVSALLAFTKMHDLYPSEKRELTGKDGGPIEVTKIESVIVDPAAEGAS
jgi:hypothetical protein